MVLSQQFDETSEMLIGCEYGIIKKEAGALLRSAGLPLLGDDQSVKNEGGKRKRPIHSSPIALGFLDFVQTIRAAGHTQLFPQLLQRKNGYSDVIDKYFTWMLDEEGLSDLLLVFKAGCPHHFEEILSGHSATPVLDRAYAHRELTPSSQLHEGLERLR